MRACLLCVVHAYAASARSRDAYRKCWRLDHVAGAVSRAGAQQGAKYDSAVRRVKSGGEYGRKAEAAACSGQRVEAVALP